MYNIHIKSEGITGGGGVKLNDGLQVLLNVGFFEILQVTIKAATGEDKAVTAVMLWDGPEGDIMPYDYYPEPDWTLDSCGCCFETPIPLVC